MASLHTIRQAQSALAASVSPEIRTSPRGEILERFLARLLDQWLKEKKQADRKPRVKPQRICRMREDLFEGVWCDVLGWLQQDQDASPVALLGRLREAEPHRSNRARLSELRRRVQRWRGIIGNNMVYVVCESSLTDPVGMRVMAPIGGHPKC